MIREELQKIEELEHRLERAERRGMDELAGQRRHELTVTRYHFLTKLIRRREDHEDDTYAQRARRQEYEELIEEQQAALEKDTDEFAESDGVKLTVADIAEIKS